MRLLCWLGWHTPASGMARDFTWAWTCVRCGCVRRGKLRTW